MISSIIKLTLIVLFPVVDLQESKDSWKIVYGNQQIQEINKTDLTISYDTDFEHETYDPINKKLSLTPARLNEVIYYPFLFRQPTTSSILPMN